MKIDQFLALVGEAIATQLTSVPKRGECAWEDTADAAFIADFSSEKHLKTLISSNDATATRLRDLPLLQDPTKTTDMYKDAFNVARNEHFYSSKATHTHPPTRPSSTAVSSSGRLKRVVVPIVLHGAVPRCRRAVRQLRLRRVVRQQLDWATATASPRAFQPRHLGFQRPGHGARHDQLLLQHGVAGLRRQELSLRRRELVLQPATQSRLLISSMNFLLGAAFLLRRRWM